MRCRRFFIAHPPRTPGRGAADAGSWRGPDRGTRRPPRFLDNTPDRPALPQLSTISATSPAGTSRRMATTIMRSCGASAPASSTSARSAAPRARHSTSMTSGSGSSGGPSTPEAAPHAFLWTRSTGMRDLGPSALFSPALQQSRRHGRLGEWSGCGEDARWHGHPPRHARRSRQRRARHQRSRRSGRGQHGQ